MVRRASRTTPRATHLKASLEARRARLIADVGEMMRGVRSRTPEERDIADTFEGSEAGIQDDLDLAMIQMKAETLRRIDLALQRLDAGVYGDCVECGQAISKGRLQALPFAVRCTSCEEARERRSTGVPKPSPHRSYPHRLLDAAD